MFPDDHVVRDLHEVVDFHPFLNPGAAKTRAIDRRVGADLDVVVDLDDANLWHFFVPAGGHFEAEAVRADDRAAVNDDAIADPDPLPNRDVGINQAAGADDRLVTDITVRAEAGAVANPRARFHDRVRADRDRFA